MNPACQGHGCPKALLFKYSSLTVVLARLEMSPSILLGFSSRIHHLTQKETTGTESEIDKAVG